MKTQAQIMENMNDNQKAGFKFGRGYYSHDMAETAITAQIRLMMALEGDWTPENRQEYQVAVILSFGPGDTDSANGTVYKNYKKRCQNAAKAVGYKIPNGEMNRNTGTDTYEFPLHLEKLPAKKDSTKKLAPSKDKETGTDNGTVIQPKAKTNPVVYAQSLVDAIPDDVTLYQVIKSMSASLNNQQVTQLVRHLDKVLDNADGGAITTDSAATA